MYTKYTDYELCIRTIHSQYSIVTYISYMKSVLTLYYFFNNTILFYI